MLETLFPARYFFPFVKRFLSIRYIVLFVSTFPSIWYFLSFVSTLPSCSCTSSSRSSRSCGCVLPFVSIPIQSFCWHVCFIATRLFCLLLPSFVSTIPPLVTSFLSFQLLPSVCCQVVHFDTSVLTFHLSVSICCFFPFALPLTARLLLELFRCNSFLSFVTSFLSLQLFPSVRPFLSFQLFPFIRAAFHFASTLSFHSLLPSSRFNSSLPFASSFRFNSFLAFVFS